MSEKKLYKCIGCNQIHNDNDYSKEDGDVLIDEKFINGLFELDFCEDDKTVKLYVKECEGKHIQQVVYSTYHNALTQICFGCKKIRTSLKQTDANAEKDGGEK